MLHWFLDDVWLDFHSAKSRHVVKFSSASLPICFFFAFKRLIVPKSLALNFYKQLWIAIWKLSIDDWRGPNKGNERNLDSKSCYIKVQIFWKKATKIWKNLPLCFDISKGRLISKCLFGVIVWTKKPTNFFPGFLP